MTHPNPTGRIPEPGQHLTVELAGIVTDQQERAGVPGLVVELVGAGTRDDQIRVWVPLSSVVSTRRTSHRTS